MRAIVFFLQFHPNLLSQLLSSLYCSESSVPPTELQPGHETLPLVIIPIGPSSAPLFIFPVTWHPYSSLQCISLPLYLCPDFPLSRMPFPFFFLCDELLITLQGPDVLPWLSCHSIVKSCHLQNWLHSPMSLWHYLPCLCQVTYCSALGTTSSTELFLLTSFLLPSSKESPWHIIGAQWMIQSVCFN